MASISFNLKLEYEARRETCGNVANFELADLDNHQTIEMASIDGEMAVGGTETLDSGIERSKNPTPSILINSEERALFDDAPSRDRVSVTNESDQMLQNHTESKSDLETDDSDAAADHHSRLLRLLSSETGNQEEKPDSPVARTGSPETDPANVFLPLELPGVRLRVRSLRAKDRIPSRLFRSLQHEFDSSSEDVRQPSSSSASPPGHAGVSAGFFRFPHLYASVTPETPSSAASELETFFPSQAK